VTDSSVRLFQPHRFNCAEHFFVEIDHLGGVADAEIGRHPGCSGGSRIYFGWHVLLLKADLPPRCSRGASADFFWCEVLYMSGDLPNIAEWISDRGPAVTVEHIPRFLDHSRATFYRAPIGVVRIVEIEVKERGHRVAHAGFSDHYNRIADANLRWAVVSKASACAEGVFEKIDQPGGVRHEQPGCYRMPALRNRFDRHRRLRKSVRYALQRRCDVPDVAEGVLHPTASVAPVLVFHRVDDLRA
jgi:hypothetical protein